MFEGEEEAGSEHLPEILKRNAALYSADALLLCDGPVNQTRKMQLYFGARGEIGVEMTVYGPLRALHSGHYGNWAPNPAAMLAHLLSSMRDENAHVNVPGFYDDVRPLTQTEREAIRQIPDVSGQLRQELGLAWTEGEPEPVLMRITQPALNIRGFESGHVGEKAQNAIPTEARASVDLRLVPDQDPEKVKKSFESYVKDQGFFIVSEDPDLNTRLAHPRIIKLAWSYLRVRPRRPHVNGRSGSQGCHSRRGADSRHSCHQNAYAWRYSADVLVPGRTEDSSDRRATGESR